MDPPTEGLVPPKDGSGVSIPRVLRAQEPEGGTAFNRAYCRKIFRYYMYSGLQPHAYMLGWRDFRVAKIGFRV